MNSRLSTDMTAPYNAPADVAEVAESLGWRSWLTGRLWRLLRAGPITGRRGLILNASILAAILLVVGLTVWTVFGSESEPVSTAQTVKVGTGDVTATVSANGNVASGSISNADFKGNGGIVTEILVDEGDKVEKGQVLARVDSISARQALAKAQAQLDAAEASYEGTTEGQTSAEEKRDARSVDQAETTLRSAKQTLALTTSQQNQAVARAANDLTTAQNTYSANPTTANKQAVQSAESALTSAKNSRDTAILQAKQQVTSAKASLKSTNATVAVNSEDPKDSDVKSSWAQVRQAQVGVAEAQTTLDETGLLAPVSGTVTKINGTVGEATDTGNNNASSSSSTDGSDSSTDTSGFITLTATDALEVTADVAEADIADVRIGQDAAITLSASEKEVSGQVTAIDSTETVTNNVVEYGVTVTLDEAEGIKLGQSTQVSVITGSKSDVLRVSSSALTTIGGNTTATVRGKNGATRTASVVTGLEGDGFTEVLSGLHDGDTVEIPKQSGSSSGFSFPGGGLGRGLGG